MSMETMFVSLGFFAAAFAATVAAIALSFTDWTMWSVALSVVAAVFALAGMLFTFWNRREHHRKESKE